MCNGSHVLKGGCFSVSNAFHNQRLVGINPLPNGVGRLGIVFVDGIEEDGFIAI
jgi:hypothetical protein